MCDIAGLAYLESSAREAGLGELRGGRVDASGGLPLRCAMMMES
jgi:hypothetical protein